MNLTKEGEKYVNDTINELCKLFPSKDKDVITHRVWYEFMRMTPVLTIDEWKNIILDNSESNSKLVKLDDIHYLSTTFNFNEIAVYNFKTGNIKSFKYK